MSSPMTSGFTGFGIRTLHSVESPVASIGRFRSIAAAALILADGYGTVTLVLPRVPRRVIEATEGEFD